MTPSILVVDDERDLLSTYERLLARRGFRVVTAATREAGLDAVRSERLALVVSDLRLPDGDGLDIVRSAATTHTPPPVIVVTGFGSPSTRRRALDAGASAFLAKPFSVPGFMALVDRLLPGGPGGPDAGRPS
jgi:DNA-binding response OmpR family regulator